jgi:cholesterol transport system auxiliary component
MNKKMQRAGAIGIILILSLLSGCMSSSQRYMLTAPVAVEKHYTKQLPVIGVEEITLPEYMKQGKVAIQLTPTQIHYSASDEWMDNMENSLTKQLIATIQKSFNHPSVYPYPWGLSQQASIKIKVTISRFIAYGDSVYLDANWKISDLRRGREYSRLFSTKVPCGKDTASVVVAMNRAFGKLSQSIVGEINRKF